MSQHDFVVDDASGAVVRADLNAALQALASDNAGATAPATTYAYQRWSDTANNVRWQRNSGNSAWILRERTAAEGMASKGSGFTAGLADFGKAFDISAALTVSFSAAATLTDGWWCDIRNRGSGNVTLDPNSSEQIDGAATLTLYPGESCRVWCNGSAFRTVGLPPVAVGDSGSGGTRGLVPAPAAGDAAASKYLKADMTWTAISVTQPGWILIDSEVASAQASVVLTGLSSTYSKFVIVGEDIAPASDGVRPLLHVSTDGGSTYHSATSWDGSMIPLAAAGTAQSVSEGSGVLKLLPGGGNSLQLGNDTNNAFSFTLWCGGFSSTTKRKQVHGTMAWTGSEATGTDYAGAIGAGLVLAAAVTAVKFTMSGGGNFSGWFAIYGLRKS